MQNQKILIVEDDLALGQEIAQTLKQNYKPVLKTTYKEAKKVLNNNFNLYLLDIILPDHPQGGLELAKQIQKDDIEKPIIFLSIKSEIETKLRAFEIGAIDYLTKPFNLTELKARVKAHTKKTKLFKIGDLEIDVLGRKVYRNNKEISA